MRKSSFSFNESFTKNYIVGDESLKQQFLLEMKRVLTAMCPVFLGEYAGVMVLLHVLLHVNVPNRSTLLYAYRVMCWHYVSL